MEKVKIGLVGFGTIGSGLVSILAGRRELLSRRTGVDIELVAVCDCDFDRPRPVDLPPVLRTGDYRRLTDDPGIGVIVELVGGIEPAMSIIDRALENGKSIVTANKALLSEKGDRIMEKAAARGCHIGFEAAVCGAIPLIRGIRDGLVADHLTSLHGILNGTTNFILTRMGEDRLSLEQALDLARAGGYAERDADLDLSGLDSSHKISILAALVTGRFFPASGLLTEGIVGITAQDMGYAAELGYAVKLLSIMRQEAFPGEGPGRAPQSPFIATYPALIPAHHLLASVREVDNAVHFSGELAGEGLFFGRGAGMLPTAGSVAADIVTIGRRVAHRVPPARPWVAGGPPAAGGQGLMANRFYLRVSALDRPGVFARIAEVLGRHEIGIASCIQKEESPRRAVPVVMTTHLARESDVARALAEIRQLPVVTGDPVCLRIALDRESASVPGKAKAAP